MESYPLLETKLYIPPVRPELVSRTRLLERLNAGLWPKGLQKDSGFARKLTLISAPAGFGKTTLVSEWAHKVGAQHTAPQVAWLSLDEGDNDPARFLAYMIAALQTAEARQESTGRIGAGVLSALHSPQPPPVEVVLTSLINEIAALPDRIILVLDDYHLIETQPLPDAFTFLLEHQPPQMHLVIATREDPLLSLARLRARGQLTELRATDLRFSSSEAAEFLDQVMGLDLSVKDIAALEERTEGWIAGLQLAAISMQGRRDASSLVESFTGSHRFVLDYLIEEVLEQQPESIQRFLLQTAVLDRLTGSLCDAVCFGDAEALSTAEAEADSGQTILEGLERANLFIVPLDEERRWYRYHHLFADLLRRRLRQTQFEQVPTLHRRASEWYEQNGFVDQAIEHALRAEGFERAAHLIEEHADALWGRGEHVKLRRWLTKLPIELAFTRPHLCIYHAWYLFVSGQQEAAERSLQAAEQALDSSLVLSTSWKDPVEGTDRATETKLQEQDTLAGPDRMKLQGRVAAVRAFMVSYRGDVPGIIQYASRALEYLPEQDRTWRSLSAIVLGDAYGFKGDMTAAYEARFEALKACKAAGDIYYVMLAGLKLAITLRAQGRLQQTLEICQEQMQLAHEYGLSQTSLNGLFLVIWGEVLAELNDLEGAIDQANKGVELAELAVDMALLGWGYMCLMRILFSRGEFAGIKEIIEKMENTARESNVPTWITNQMAAWQARLWLAQGKLEAASQWVRERGLVAAGEPRPPHEFDFFSLNDHVMLARILIAQERLDEATRLLPRLLEAAEAGDRRTRVIEILNLQALALQAGGDSARAVTTLERALILAEPEGFIRTFVDEGPLIASLLGQLHRKSVAVDYTAQILAAFETTRQGTGDDADADIRPQTTQTTLDPSSALVEPLSERELEVLQLVAEGLTNREIASRLFLTLNTVKAHTRNIYGKLGVRSRTQAVARARALGVLPFT
jgi:LuxR family maltose regulon positive regulatory protein